MFNKFDIKVHIDPDGEYGVTILKPQYNGGAQITHLSDLTALDDKTIYEFLDIKSTVTEQVTWARRINLMGELAYNANVGSITEDQFFLAALALGCERTTI